MHQNHKASKFYKDALIRTVTAPATTPDINKCLKVQRLKLQMVQKPHHFQFASYGPAYEPCVQPCMVNLQVESVDMLRVVHTIWHENLMAIKFYSLSKLLKYKKSTDSKFYGNRSNLVSLQHNSKS